MLAAGQDGSRASEAALRQLCETYWYPLYVYVRRRGHQPADAQDLIQAFFAQLLEDNFVEAADPQRGRFRSFLLTVLKRFMGRQQERAAAQKRGGGQQILSLHLDQGEERYQLEPQDDWTPERAYERRWALTLLERVLAELRADYEKQEKTELFDALKIYMTADSEMVPYAQTAERIGLSEGAVKTAVFRLRRRYRELLQQEVANTVQADDEVDGELGYLLNALRG